MSATSPVLGPAISPAAELQQLQTRLQEVRCELKRKRRQISKGTSVTARTLRVARAIVCLQNGSTEACREWFRRSGDLSSEVIAACAEKEADWYRTSSGEERGHILDQSNSVARARAHREACCFLREHRLHAWVEQTNVAAGVAPTSSMVLDRHVHADVGGDGHAHGSLLRCRKHQLQWLRRWRQRWGVKLGRIRSGEYLAVEDAQRKVAGNIGKISGTIPNDFVGRQTHFLSLA